MHADTGGLVHEEGERLVERREVGSDRTQLGEGEPAQRPGRRAVADLVQVVGVRDDELAGAEAEHVELDEVHSGLERRAERAQRVLGRERGRSAMADAERPSVASFQGEHARPTAGSGRKSSSSRPP